MYDFNMRHFLVRLTLLKIAHIEQGNNNADHFINDVCIFSYILSYKHFIHTFKGCQQ